MTVLDIIATIFASTWGIFTGTEVPGLGISFASWLLALFLVGLAIKLVNYVFGFGGSGSGYRSKSGGKKNISRERKNDEK